MEEKMVVLRSYGRKEKRQASHISVKLIAQNYFHLVNGDTLNLVAEDPSGTKMILSLLIGSTLVIRPGDEITIKAELNTVTLIATVER